LTGDFLYWLVHCWLHDVDEELPPEHFFVVSVFVQQMYVHGLRRSQKPLSPQYEQPPVDVSYFSRELQEYGLLSLQLHAE
jgi:hypothetical protein